MSSAQRDAIVVVDRLGSISRQPRQKPLETGSATVSVGFPLVSRRLPKPAPRCSGEVVEMRVVETDWEDEPAYLATLRTSLNGSRRGEQRRPSWAYARAAAEGGSTDALPAESLTLLASSYDYPGGLAALPTCTSCRLGGRVGMDTLDTSPARRWRTATPRSDRWRTSSVAQRSRPMSDTR
jgi:hypothetical protein